MKNHSPRKIETKFEIETTWKEKIILILNYGRLAPSTHNTQPWLFRIKENSLELFLNKNRVLTYSDPIGREAFISLGCVLQNIILASQCFHLNPTVQYLFQDDLIAKVEFKEADQPLIDEDKKTLLAIASRQNNTFSYQDKKISQDFISSLKNFQEENLKVFFCQNENLKKQLIEIVLKAIKIAFKDKRFCQELSQWIKPSLKKYKDGMLGYTMGMPFPLSFVIPLIIRFFDSSKIQVKMNQQALLNSPALIVIATKKDDKFNWLKSGEAFEKISILAQKEGLTTGVMAASIEIENFYQEVMAILKTDFRPQVFFRIGYPAKTHSNSPRLPLEKVLLLNDN